MCKRDILAILLKLMSYQLTVVSLCNIREKLTPRAKLVPGIVYDEVWFGVYVKDAVYICISHHYLLGVWHSTCYVN